MDLLYSCRISRVLQYSGYPPACFNFTYETITLFGATFQTLQLSKHGHYAGPSPQQYYYCWFGLFPVRSPLLRKSLSYFLFLMVLRCFSSHGSLRVYYVFVYGYHTFNVVSFLIRRSPAELICSLPKLIAAYHVLHRRLVPRHSPIRSL